MKLTHNQIREISSRDRFIFSPTYKEKKRLAYIRRAVRQAKKEKENERQVMLSEAHKGIRQTAMERVCEIATWLTIGIILGFWLK